MKNILSRFLGAFAFMFVLSFVNAIDCPSGTFRETGSLLVDFDKREVLFVCPANGNTACCIPCPIQ